MKGYRQRIREKSLLLARAMLVSYQAPTRIQLQLLLFGVGIGLFMAGQANLVEAQHSITYNDDKIAEAVRAILTYIEGSFGAMVMVAAGIGAILSSAFGQYRASLGLLVVAVGSFILRSFVHTFFNADHLMENQS